MAFAERVTDHILTRVYLGVVAEPAKYAIAYWTTSFGVYSRAILASLCPRLYDAVDHSELAGKESALQFTIAREDKAGVTYGSTADSSSMFLELGDFA